MRNIYFIYTHIAQSKVILHERIHEHDAENRYQNGQIHKTFGYQLSRNGIFVLYTNIRILSGGRAQNKIFFCRWNVFVYILILFINLHIRLFSILAYIILDA